MGLKPIPIEIGSRYGRLTVIAVSRSMRSGQQRRFAVVRCDCGAEKHVPVSVLVRGSTKSCGCLSRENSRTRSSQMFKKHGQTKSLIHRIWSQAKQRCFNPKNAKYPSYGGRGISMCERWRNDFSAFVEDMGPRPSPKHSIDRWPDNDGNYEPGNCRWATSKEQRANQRPARRAS